MKNAFPEVLERGRFRRGAYRSDPGDSFGAFDVRGPCGHDLHILASDGRDDDGTDYGWEHVSVSLRNRPPNWREMCFVKDLFWSEDEAVVQFHPPRTQYINDHPHCLHLWRPTNGEIPLPPKWMVGADQGQTTAEAYQVGNEEMVRIAAAQERNR